MNLNGGPSAWVLMCFSCCVAIDLFDKDVSVKIRSAVLEASYREPKPDGIEGKDNFLSAYPGLC